MIKIIRVTTGEVIIADITELDDGSVSTVRPALMQMQMMEPGKIGVGMIPYHPLTTGPIVFKASSLLGPPNDVDDHTARGYNERFNPDAIIVTPPSGILLG